MLISCGSILPPPTPAPARMSRFSSPSASSRSRILAASSRSRISAVCILVSRELLVKGLRWRLGDRQNISAFLDPWLPRPISFKPISPAPLEDVRPVKGRKAIFPRSSLPAAKDPGDSEDSDVEKYTAEEIEDLVLKPICSFVGLIATLEYMPSFLRGMMLVGIFKPLVLDLSMVISRKVLFCVVDTTPAVELGEQVIQRYMAESTIVPYIGKVMQKIPKEMQVSLVTLLWGGAGAYLLGYLRVRFNYNLTAGAYIRGKSEKGKAVLEGKIVKVGLFSTDLLDCNNKIVRVSNLAFEGERVTISKYQYWKVTVTVTLKTFKEEKLNRMIWAIQSCLKGYKDLLENEVGHIQPLGSDDNVVTIIVNYGITTDGLLNLPDLNIDLQTDLTVALRKICSVKDKIKVIPELC
ncbi:hypothetical protein Ddye_024080 [Dipteronia dyeriana]|uniref:Uncharacterized protein n=1 Tax=Dipteronia dyeriana TaxID=168575 RepID=A0AAD9WTX9_9ROSI|nr:hypothetical protein Ddye_024080 [Dipteronia dyeriana]